MELAYPLEDEVELDFEADLRAQDAWRESQLMQETGGLGSMARGILRPGGRHTIVCRHWLRDLCMKGDKCDFLHQYDLARMPECAQWSRFVTNFILDMILRKCNVKSINMASANWDNSAA